MGLPLVIKHNGTIVDLYKEIEISLMWFAKPTPQKYKTPRIEGDSHSQEPHLQHHPWSSVTKKWATTMATTMALVALVAWDMAMVPAMALGAMVVMDMDTFVPLSIEDINPLDFTEKADITSELWIFWIFVA